MSLFSIEAIGGDDVFLYVVVDDFVVVLALAFDAFLPVTAGAKVLCVEPTFGGAVHVEKHVSQTGGLCARHKMIAVAIVHFLNAGHFKRGSTGHEWPPINLVSQFFAGLEGGIAASSENCRGADFQ